MVIRRRRGWELPESAATPEAVFLSRRRLVQAIAAGPMLAAGLAGPAEAGTKGDPSASLYPAKRNPRYTLDRPVTPARYSEYYNNFYEFGSEKSIADPALDDQGRRAGRQAVCDRHRRSAEKGDARRAPLSPSLRRGLGDGGAVDRFSDVGLSLTRTAAVRGEICAYGDFSEPFGRAGTEGNLVSLALCRGHDDGRGGKRACLSRHWHVRQAAAKAGRRAAQAGLALEIRVQVDKVDRARVVHRRAPEDLLVRGGAERVRVLGQCQPGGAASALEPGERAPARHRRAGADANLERLWGIRRPSL